MFTSKSIKTFRLFAVALFALLVAGCSQLFIAPQNQNEFEAYFLDVGQGDAFLARTSNAVVMIDAGTNKGVQSLVDQLKKVYGIIKIDVLIGTHPHEDHIGGMDSIIEAFEVTSVYMPRATTTTQTFQDVLLAIKEKGLTIKVPNPGENLALGGMNLRFLAPGNGEYKELNNYSIVTEITYKNSSILVTGDAEAEAEEEMLGKNIVRSVDVLKVGHHGSSTSSTPEFIAAVNPRFAVISCGKNNSYGHPHPKTLETLSNSTVLRTDQKGTIRFRYRDGQILHE